MKRLLFISITISALLLFLSPSFGGEGGGSLHEVITTFKNTSDTKPDEFQDNDDEADAIVTDYTRTPNHTWSPSTVAQITDAATRLTDAAHVDPIPIHRDWWQNEVSREVLNFIRDLKTEASQLNTEIEAAIFEIDPSNIGKADPRVDLWFIKAGVEGKLDLLVDHLPASLNVELIENLSVFQEQMMLSKTLEEMANTVTSYVNVKE